jgi:hypothetical protein
MVRNTDDDANTIISYHPHDTENAHPTTSSAEALHTRLRLVGKSVYWRTLFSTETQMEDPTLVLLAMLWHALYSWDEVMEKMNGYFCDLVSFFFWQQWVGFHLILGVVCVGIAGDHHERYGAHAGTSCPSCSHPAIQILLG